MRVSLFPACCYRSIIKTSLLQNHDVADSYILLRWPEHRSAFFIDLHFCVFVSWVFFRLHCRRDCPSIENNIFRVIYDTISLSSSSFACLFGHLVSFLPSMKCCGSSTDSSVGFIRAVGAGILGVWKRFVG